jgi:dTDP-4-dehydrorhamnose reductase
VSKSLEETNPSVIINLAAFTNVDGCEKNKEYAVQLNAILPKVISDFITTSRRKGIDRYFLHVSTDYVFDGEDGNYIEESQTNPINWYGKTKLSGEHAITTNLESKQWCIARISTPFGIHPTKQSFPVYVLNRVSKTEYVHLVTDQYTSPTYALDLARIFDEIIKRRISGIIHAACLSRLSRYEQGIKVANVFNLDSSFILRSSSKSMNWLAPRPKDSSLNVTKALNLLRYRPRDYDTCIKEFYSEVSNSTG